MYSLPACQGFTLIELLVVIAILALLAALLFPVFAQARNSALQSACLSQMHQISLSVSMYDQDYDSLYPWAVDPADRYEGIWRSVPQFNSQIPSMPWLYKALQPYVHSLSLFHCPSDTGFNVDEMTGGLLDPNSAPPNAEPSSFAKFGTSYYYHTALAQQHIVDGSLPYPAETHVIYDGSGKWHGTAEALRYNAAFADGHAKSLTYAQIMRAWDVPLH